MLVENKGIKMNTYKLSLPNDYQSEGDDAAMVAAGESYEKITIAAKAAGLKYIRDTDFGAEWGGTADQFAECVKNLPEWAKRYASKNDQ